MQYIMPVISILMSVVVLIITTLVHMQKHSQALGKRQYFCGVLLPLLKRLECFVYSLCTICINMATKYAEVPIINAVHHSLVINTIIMTVSPPPVHMQKGTQAIDQRQYF